MSENYLTTLQPTLNDTDTGLNAGSFTLDPTLRQLLLIILIIITLKGMATNVINIVVFFKLRKTDPINISLLGLAISDFIICLTTLVFFMGTSTFLIEILTRKLKIHPIHVFYMTAGILHTAAVRITMLLTAFIATERCACVVFPLHIKSIITHRKIWISVTFAYTVGLLDFLSVWYTTRLAWQYDTNLNMTILSSVMMDNFYSVNVIVSPLKLALLILLPFIVVSVATGILITHLRRSMMFRNAASSLGRGRGRPSADSGQGKETKVFKMVLIICLMFIVCYIPNTAFVMLISFTSFTNLQHAYRNDLQVIYYFGFLFDSINSSVNIWIYYFNSSNYKKIFKKTFHLKGDD